MNLKKVKIGSKCRVVELKGGTMFNKKAESLGIRVGSIIEKKTAQLMNGPITVQIGSTNIALGIGMAEKIIVDIN